MNYRVDTSKAYVDKTDGELVALMNDTGVYYTFSCMASALIEDLDTGFSLEEVTDAITVNSKQTVTIEGVRKFVGELTAAGILAEDGERTAKPEGGMKVSTVTDDYSLEMTQFSDVAEYFRVDPIHEVDPSIGWKFGQKP